MPKIDFKQKYLKAFKLYLLGEDITKIAAQCEVNKLTIYRWIERNKWVDFKEKQIRELQEKVYSNVTEEKERSLKLLKAGEALWATKLNKGEFQRINFSDIALIQRAKWEILAPKSMTQFNFMKNENTGPNYRFELVNPDNDNQHKVETQPEAETGI